MTRLPDKRAILGIDPTKRGLAFASFEDGRLLDWGTRRDDGKEVALVDRLITLCAPEVVVIEDQDAPRCERRPRMRRLLRAIEQRAIDRRLAVEKVSRHKVRLAWAERGITTKQGVAAAIAEQFPELEPLVPPRRKTYMSEDPRVHVFDAASLVLHVAEKM